eukprot:TRINITY_DN3760_c0_g1_i3.p1 TRINITY_DN3760_c0_g1~~TRINITY_DN3760_c0_g1_i3.p1  ORF type:complete len:476 (-),score=149.57 TRINITY_DN3760_c0_g1_i3:18-1445(-)
MNLEIFVLAICLFSVSYAESAVLNLTDANFDDIIQNNKVVMVKFFAPWCGHCQHLAPEYEKAAEMAIKNNKTFILGELDATVQKQTAEKYGVSGYPTLKLFIEGNIIDFDGERTAEALYAFMDKKSSPPTKELESIEQIKEQVKGKGRRCIFIGDDPSVLTDYINIARDVNEFDFYTTSESVGKEAFPELNSFPAVVLLKDYDEKKAVLAGTWSEQFTDFLKVHQYPIMGKVTREIMDNIFKPSTRKAVVLFRSASSNSAQALEREFEKLALARRSSKYYFMVSDIKSDPEQRLTDYLGLEAKEFPVVEILEENEGELNRYRHKGHVLSSELLKFLENFEAGKIQRYLKSEDIPKTNDGPVIKVVGKTFQSEVISNDMDVLMLFYAEWCGHCKKLHPIYKELAEKLKSIKTLKIANVDSTKNDLVGHVIHGFPTIKMFPANRKDNPIEFEGNRTCLLYTSPSPRDLSTSRMPSSA